MPLQIMKAINLTALVPQTPWQSMNREQLFEFHVKYHDAKSTGPGRIRSNY